MSNYKMVLSRSASPTNICRQTCKLYLLHRVHDAIPWLLSIMKQDKKNINLLSFQRANTSTKNPLEDPDKLIAAKPLPWRS